MSFGPFSNLFWLFAVLLVVAYGVADVNAIGLSENCTVNENCTAANSSCQDGICTCLSTHYEANNEGNKSCELKVALGGNCTGGKVCGDSNATCTSNNTCQCNQNFYVDNGPPLGGICRPKIDLGSSCTNVSNEKVCNDSNAVCSGTCECISGYYNNSGTCELKKNLGSPCTNVSNEQVCKDSNAVCSGTSGTSGTCQCKSDYYNNSGICESKKNLGSPCTNVSNEQVCKDSNAVCSGTSGTSGTCQCKSDYYNNSGICESKKNLGSPCTNVSNEQVCKDSNAVCFGTSGTSGTCQCKSDYYNNSGICASKKNLGSPCTNVSNEQVCKDSNAVCFGTSGTSGTCQCKSDYYNNSGICASKKNLGSPCTNVSNEQVCKDSNAVCFGTSGTSGTCQCKSDYYNNSGICASKKNLGSPCTNVSNEQVCKDSNAVCFGTSGTSGTCQCKSDYYNNSGICASMSLLKVSNISFSNIQTTSFLITWKNPDGISAVQRIEIKIGVQSVVNITDKGTSYSATGLTAGTRYNVTVISVNTDDRPTEQSVSTSKIQTTKPAKPGPLTSSVYHAPYISIKWTQGSESVDSYEVSLVDGGNYSQTKSVNISVANFTSAVPGVYYNISIIAILDQLRSEPYTDRIRTTVTSPDPPTNVKCPTNPMDTSLEISWTAPMHPNGIIQSYIVNINNTKVNIVSNQNTSSPITNLIITGLSPETKYRITVQSVNDGTDSVKVGLASDAAECETRAGELELGTNCTTSLSCAGNNVECSTNSKCQCKSTFYDTNNNDTGGQCKPISELVVSGIVFSNIQTTSFQVAWNNPTAVSAVEEIRIQIGNKTEVIPGKGEKYNATGLTPGTTYTVTVISVDTNSRPAEQSVNTSMTQTTKLELGTNCTTSLSCAGNNVECSTNSKCQCKSTFYDTNNNDTGGQCKPISELVVSGIVFSNIQTTSFQVAWNNPTAVSAVEEIRIQIGNKTEVIPGKGEKYNATGLTPGTTYTVTVISVDTNSRPAEQSVNTSMTQTTKLELGTNCTTSLSCAGNNVECSTNSKCQCKSTFYDTNNNDTGGQCKPISDLKVSGIVFSNVQTTSFQVAWNNPTAVSAVEEIRIKIGNKTVFIPGKGEKYDATGLTPGTSYNVTVISVDTNSRPAEQSVSTSKNQTTKPAKPGPLTSSVYHAPYISIKWTQGSGSVDSYEVSLMDGGNYSQTTNVNVPVANFTSVVPGVYYDISIIAIKDQLRSEPYTDRIRTNVTSPDPPTNVKCPTNPMDTSLEISWTAPMHPNGIIQSYIVNINNTKVNIVSNQNTSSPITNLIITGLSPETKYRITVQSVNDGTESVKVGPPSAAVECKTRAGVSTPPQNVQALNIAATGFTLKYDKPLNVSGVLAGYRIVIKNDSICAKEIVISCSTCNLPNFTNDCPGNLIQLNRSVSGTSQTTNITGLSPYINYTIIVAAINGIGPGNINTSYVLTSEDVPKAPTQVKKVSSTATSVFVNWEIDGPRPGITAFNVSVYEDIDGVDIFVKSQEVHGFYERSVNITNLEEYWSYKFQVTAITSNGSNASSKSSAIRTKSAAPGAVTDFKVVKISEESFRKIEVSWAIPKLRDRNGHLTNYVFFSNVSGVLENTSIPVSFGGVKEKRYFNITPETYYQFKVYTTNNESMDGKEETQIYFAPAGPPPVPGNIDNIIPTEVGSHNPSQTSFQININLNIFRDNLNGKIQSFGIAVCEKSKCSDDDIPKSYALQNQWKTWNMARKIGFPLYRVTGDDYIVHVKQSFSRRKRSTVIGDSGKYEVGEVNNCSVLATNVYCNGPLDPDKSYQVLVFLCTNGGCSNSGFSDPYNTLAVPAEPQRPPYAAISGGAVAVAAAVFVVIMVIIIRRRRRKSPNTTPVPHRPFDNAEGEDVIGMTKILRKRPILLSEFSQKVEEKHKDSNLLFAKEYEDIKTLSPKHPTEQSELDENKMKNRYVNILPFDHSRVKLLPLDDDPTTDFINANYLPGYRSEREYIGAQGPIPGTVDDFWRMVWEQNVAIIVMLTLCKEEGRVKCEMYWPMELREPKQYGDLVVETISCSTVNFYDFRIFKLKLGDVTRTLKHFHFLQWKDFSANVQNDVMIDFIKNVRAHIQPPDMNGPVLVHCSAGVGRTGTYISLDHLLQFIDAHDFGESIDIFDLVMNLREKRMFMVQTEQQYVFIHDCVKVYLAKKIQELQGEHLYDNVNRAFVQDEDECLYQNVNNGPKTEL